MMKGRPIRLRSNIRKRWLSRGVRIKRGKQRKRVLRPSAEASRQKDRREMGRAEYLNICRSAMQSPRTPESNLKSARKIDEREMKYLGGRGNAHSIFVVRPAVGLAAKRQPSRASPTG